MLVKLARDGHQWLPHRRTESLTGPLGLTTTLGGSEWAGRCGVVALALLRPLPKPEAPPTAGKAVCCPYDEFPAALGTVDWPAPTRL